MPARLALSLTNSPEDTKQSSPLWFQQEEGKKSAFTLDLNGVSSIEKPAHAVIHCLECDGDDDQSVPFLFGGLELVSNSRNVEVYTSDDKGKEEYMKTCRGIVYDNKDTNSSADDSQKEEEWFKCVIVCNGGPRSVSRVNLKLLSLRPAKCTRATLNLVKLKGRLPDVPEETKASATSQPTATPATPAFNKQTTSTNVAGPQQQPQNPALTQEDIGSAMAAMSMLVRVAEDRLARNINTGLQRVEASVGKGFAGFQQSLSELCNVVVSQRSTLQQQNVLLVQQQEMMKSQNLMVQELQKSQEELIETTKSLREEMMSLRNELSEQRQTNLKADECKDVEEVPKGETSLGSTESPSQSKEADSDVSALCEGVADDSTPVLDDRPDDCTDKSVSCDIKPAVTDTDAEVRVEETRKEEEVDVALDQKTSENEKSKVQEGNENTNQDHEDSSTHTEEDDNGKASESLGTEEAGETHLIEDDSSAVDAEGALVMPPCSPGGEEEIVKPVAAMNPVPEQHWSLDEGDLLGLDDDNGSGVG